MSDLLRFQPSLPVTSICPSSHSRPHMLLLSLMVATLWTVSSAAPLPTGSSIPSWRRTLRVPTNTHTLLDYDRDIIKQLSMIRANTHPVSHTSALDKRNAEDTVIICNVPEIKQVFRQKYDSVITSGVVGPKALWNENELPPFTFEGQCPPCPETTRGVQTASPIQLPLYVLVQQEEGVEEKDGCKMYKLTEKQLKAGCQCGADPKGDPLSTVSPLH